mmetsp:Transcript_150980/g.485200  ORF Transcript_150980/g.485200 Transcript_150980/m.485200 type:complete len:270 (+) Transcript_150980:462-1271(+)
MELCQRHASEQSFRAFGSWVQCDEPQLNRCQCNTKSIAHDDLERLLVQADDQPQGTLNELHRTLHKRQTLRVPVLDYRTEVRKWRGKHDDANEHRQETDLLCLVGRGAAVECQGDVEHHHASGAERRALAPLGRRLLAQREPPTDGEVANGGHKTDRIGGHCGPHGREDAPDRPQRAVEEHEDHRLRADVVELSAISGEHFPHLHRGREEEEEGAEPGRRLHECRRRLQRSDHPEEWRPEHNESGSQRQQQQHPCPLLEDGLHDRRRVK